jgi:steroid delta-isomerase-like uncharacterized protein
MHTERSKEVVREAIAALNARDLDRFFSLHTPDTTSQEVYFSEPLDRDEFGRFLVEFLHAYPDAHIDTVNMICEAGIVAVENVMTATFVNEFRGVQPTGRTYSAREAVFFELESNKIRRARIYLDQKSIEAQLGLAP